MPVIFCVVKSGSYDSFCLYHRGGDVMQIFRGLYCCIYCIAVDLNTTPVEKRLLILLEYAVFDNKGLLMWKEGKVFGLFIPFLGKMVTILKLEPNSTSQLSPQNLGLSHLGSFNLLKSLNKTPFYFSFFFLCDFETPAVIRSLTAWQHPPQKRIPPTHCCIFCKCALLFFRRNDIK